MLKVKYGNQTILNEDISNVTLSTEKKMLEEDIHIQVTSGEEKEYLEDDVIFIDYDGKIVYSYSQEDFLNLEKLPSNPSHEGLISQGWNWTLSDAKDWVREYKYLTIGQTYITDDNKTRLYVYVDNLQQLPIRFEFNGPGGASGGSASVDWGDGSEPSTATSSSTRVFHQYENTGDYVIKITPINKNFTFYNASYGSTGIFWQNSTSSSTNDWHSILRRVEIGSNFYFRQYGFSDQYAMSSITIPAYITSINSYQFYNCYSLKAITFSNSISSIAGIQNFSYCYNLGYISVPKNCSIMSSNTFYYDYSLDRVIVQDSTPSSASACFGQTKALRKIVLKGGITVLPTNMFTGNGSLRYIRLPDTVTTINSNALNFGNHLRFVRFESINPPSLASSLTLTVNQGIIIPYDSVTSYMTKTNYPAASKYRIGFGTFNIGETLPSQSTDGNYNITWYNTLPNAISQVASGVISVGTGIEIYCRYTAV